MNYKGVIFDLDGVIVDTARYHYQAWKELAEDMGIQFTHDDNERLKGVSRVQSLDILLELGKITVSKPEKEVLADRKNAGYVEMLQQLTPADLLPGVTDLMAELKRNHIKIGLGSASKNAPFILKKLDISDLFDAVIDGTQTEKAKPDPEVFLLAAKRMGLAPQECVVIEDARAGIEAALAGEMYPVGIGNKENLPGASIVMPDLFRWQTLMTLFR